MRISVTKIEQYRRYAQGITTYEDLLDSIKGDFKPSKFMELGTAFHAIIENPLAYKTDEGFYVCDDLEFDSNMIEQCIKVIDYEGEFEVKVEIPFSIFGANVTVVAKCDQLIGNKVIENKTKWSTFDYDNYAGSCQWKFYLDAFNVEAVKYNVFCFSDTVSRGIELREIVQFEMHDYPDRENEIYNLLCDFVFFIKTQNLEQYFENKHEYQN